MLALIPDDIINFLLVMTTKIVKHQPLNFAEWLFILLVVAFCVLLLWALNRAFDND